MGIEFIQTKVSAIDIKELLQASPWLPILIPLALYLLTVHYLRFCNIRSLERRYSKYVSDPHSMSYTDAHAILRSTMLREFPFLFFFSTQFGLIKSYGIASATKLLVQTGHLINPSVVGKRIEDTVIILGEILFEGLDSDRGLRALSKMNWIHARYGSKIMNDGLIHTLALFVLEPHRWIERFEWRPMTRLEKVAHFVYWKEIGNRMGMVDIPATLEDLQVWTAQYEKTDMYYAESNRKCYDATMALFIKDVPSFMRGFMEQIAACFLQEYFREALGVPSPPDWLQKTIDGIFLFRRWLIRHF